MSSVCSTFAQQFYGLPPFWRKHCSSNETVFLNKWWAGASRAYLWKTNLRHGGAKQTSKPGIEGEAQQRLGVRIGGEVARKLQTHQTV